VRACALMRIFANVSMCMCVCVYVSVCVGDVLDRECVYIHMRVLVGVGFARMHVCVCGVHLRTSAAVVCKHTQLLPLFLTILSPRWPPPPPRFLVPLDLTQVNYMAWRCTGRDYLSRSSSSCCSFIFSIFATRVSVGLQCVCVY
jgi:hypothetical protein